MVKKASGSTNSKYGVGGARQQKQNQQAGRAPVSRSSSKPKTGMDIFNDTIRKKK